METGTELTWHMSEHGETSFNLGDGITHCFVPWQKGNSHHSFRGPFLVENTKDRISPTFHLHHLNCTDFPLLINSRSTGEKGRENTAHIVLVGLNIPDSFFQATWTHRVPRDAFVKSRVGYWTDRLDYLPFLRNLWLPFAGPWPT